MLNTDMNSRRQTLMVVDDCETNLNAMLGLFRLDYDVVLFDNAVDAIAHTGTHDVDLILLDVAMPGMSGHEACKILKADPSTKDVPIIFVTAAGGSGDEERGLLLGAVDYIAKPFNLPVLRARVRNHMDLAYYRRQLEVLSNMDGLTGVANRRQLDSQLKQHYASAIRFGYHLALLMIDVDDFKLFNDTYGHAAGDHCLKEVAQSITAVSRRETDVIGRYGGEEFAVILPDTDPEGALIFANSLLARIRKIAFESANLESAKTVTVSIGMVVLTPIQFTRQSTSLSDFVGQADAALYRAKRNGKNRVCCADPEDRDSTQLTYSTKSGVLN